MTCCPSASPSLLPFFPSSYPSIFTSFPSPLCFLPCILSLLPPSLLSFLPFILPSLPPRLSRGAWEHEWVAPFVLGSSHGILLALTHSPSTPLGLHHSISNLTLRQNSYTRI